MGRKWQPQPLHTERLRLSDLPAYCQEAVEEAVAHLEPVPEDWPVRLETYRSADLKRLVGKVWRWSTGINDVSGDDRVRVQNIIDEISDGSPQWPYVSYFAADMPELMETETYDGEHEVLNHGDGWHRIIAALELGKPTIQVLFIERRD